jgi:3-oxoacyl-[acyl-carrier-protein] synthase II
MTGHLLGAAGAVEAAICALSIDRGWIAPTINLDAVDPACDLDYVPNLCRQKTVDVAPSNSIAFGGHNVALALRRAAA